MPMGGSYSPPSYPAMAMLMITEISCKCCAIKAFSAKQVISTKHANVSSFFFIAIYHAFITILIKGEFTGREEKVGNLREWLLTSLVEYRLTIQN